jgi:hypothetical protein
MHASPAAGAAASSLAPLEQAAKSMIALKPAIVFETFKGPVFRFIISLPFFYLFSY